MATVPGAPWYLIRCGNTIDIVAPGRRAHTCPPKPTGERCSATFRKADHMFLNVRPGMLLPHLYTCRLAHMTGCTQSWSRHQPPSKSAFPLMEHHLLGGICSCGASQIADNHLAQLQTWQGQWMESLKSDKGVCRQREEIGPVPVPV